MIIEKIFKKRQKDRLQICCEYIQNNYVTFIVKVDQTPLVYQSLSSCD